MVLKILLEMKVNEVLERNGRKGVFSTEEQDNINRLVAFLKVFKEESVDLEAEQTPTLQLVLLAFQRITDHCAPTETDTANFKLLRSRALNLLLKKFQIDEMHKIATFLWPDFRHLPILSAQDQSKVSFYVFYFVLYLLYNQ